MPAKLEAGTEVADRYRVDEEIGRGGMGAVDVADDLTLPQKVALKVLQPEALSDATARARFREEIDSCVKIEHPHVVPVHGAGFDGSHFFIAMKLIDGPDLSRIISDFAPPNETRRLGQSASQVIAAQVARRAITPSVRATTRPMSSASAGAGTSVGSVEATLPAFFSDRASIPFR